MIQKHDVTKRGIQLTFFLGPRGPYGIPLSACLRRKIWITHIQAYMPHEYLKTHQITLMAPWNPLKAHLDPLGPPGPPIDPQ